ncbi:MAG: DUF92 domain-containing protein [Bacteroidales bacterium]
MNENDQLLRKMIHVFTGLTIFMLSYLVERHVLLSLIIAGSLFAFFTYPFPYFNFIHQTSRKSYGTLFYPAGILSAFILLYPNDINFFRVALLVLTLSDTLANFGGSIKKGNYYIKVTHETKSIYGIFFFTLSSALIYLVLLSQSFSFSYFLLLIILSIHLEVISFRGSDNLSIPLGLALFFSITQNFQDHAFYGIILLVIAFGMGSFFLFRLRILTRWGSLFAYFLGVYLAGILGWKWAFPVILFFVTSVIFTKINSRINGKIKLASQRNIWQVLANILPAVISSAIYLITGEQFFIYIFIALIAAVTADTWASEIGPVFNKQCFSLYDFRFHNAGISGGISLAGTLAASFAALLISAVSWYIFFDVFEIKKVMLIAMSGLMASFVDSFLGAFLEPGLIRKKFFKYNTSKEKITPNDIVNITASLSAPLFLLMIWQHF